MYRNHKLKNAVTAALSLIAIGFQPSSFAIGLGDIQVLSHLGAPLKAKVNVLGASELSGASCLKLGANSDLSHVNFNLGKITGDSARLILTSNKVINEPILNLSVVAGCESSITRDYVLLLDPPAGLLGTETNGAEINNADVQVHKINDVATVEKTDNVAKSSTADVIASNQKVVQKVKKQKRSAKKASVKRNKQTERVAKKSIGVTQTKHQTTPKKASPETQPRLSISSGYAIAPYASTAGLRLDKQLKFKPDPNAVITNEEIAIEDEVTVMNNRLSHLQAQITALQNQNAKLKKENKLQSEQLTTQSAESGLSGSLPFLGAGLLLLLSGYTGYHWFRRRQMQIQDHQTNAIWVDTPKSDNQTITEDEGSLTSNETAAEKAEGIFSDVDFGINSVKDINQEESAAPEATMESTFESTKNEEESIVLEDEQQFSVLDHADVFLSHGRAPLAIQLLQNHLLEYPKQSVTIWLFLLDLLAKEGLESLYKETALDCKLHYNVEIAEFSSEDANNNESLEDFPRLAKGLEQVWNTPAAIVFLDDLIYNNRLEPRAGLPKNLIEELVLLRMMANGGAESAEVIRLDEKKLAIIEQKEALLESKKAEKLKKMELDAEKTHRETAAKPDADETSFEFTLVERN